jgi:predicted component of viral defense system (DUF524 family)
MLRAVKNFLHAHFKNQVRVSAHPRTAHCDLAQQRVERRARLAGVQRIDPYQDAIDR